MYLQDNPVRKSFKFIDNNRLQEETELNITFSHENEQFLHASTRDSTLQLEIMLKHCGRGWTKCTSGSVQQQHFLIFLHLYKSR